MECTSPAPTSAAYAYTSAASAGWGMDYDPTQVTWDEAPAASADAGATETVAASAGYNGYEDAAANNNINSHEYGDNTDSAAAGYENQDYEQSAVTVDG